MARSRVLAVARHEFIGTVTRLGYLITLIGMPLFVGALSGISGLLAFQTQMARQGLKQTIGIVDDSGLFTGAKLELPADPGNDLHRQLQRQLPAGAPMPVGLPGMSRGLIGLRRFQTVEQAKVALLASEVETVVRFPKAYLADGKVEELVRPPKGFNIAGLASRLRPWIVATLLEGKVAPAIADRVSRPLDVDSFFVEPNGQVSPQDMLRVVRPFIVPLGFSLLLMLSIFTSASYLATGLSEEKQNRALEMLLTSLTPEQLFWGKLIGIGGAAFLQFFLYFLVVALPASFAFKALELSGFQAVAGFSYFILGFFFFGSCLLTVGAIGNTQKYTQQLSAIFTFTAVLPLMLLTPIIDQPQGRLARVLTYVPFTAPITGLLRAGSGALPWWELLLSLACLAVGCALAVKICARIFRLALLATGTTPSLKQVWGWMRAG